MINHPHTEAHHIEKMDFFAWRIAKAKSEARRAEINRIFSDRTRLRPKNHLN